jgi:hypothetical protein
MSSACACSTDARDPLEPLGLAISHGAGSQALPSILFGLPDNELTQALQIGQAIKDSRAKTSTQSMMDDMKKVAPDFKGQILDFQLDDKFTRQFLRDAPDPPTDISIPTVKEADTIYPRDVKEAKAMDQTLTDISNRLLGATSYLLDVLQSLTEESDKRLGEYIFRAMALTASGAAALEVERLLRPGDRDRVGAHASSATMPSVIQDVRKTPVRAALFSKRAAPERDDPGFEPDFEPVYMQKRGHGIRRRSPSNYAFRRGSPSPMRGFQAFSGGWARSYAGAQRRGTESAATTTAPPP